MAKKSALDEIFGTPGMSTMPEEDSFPVSMSQSAPEKIAIDPEADSEDATATESAAPPMSWSNVGAKALVGGLPMLLGYLAGGSRGAGAGATAGSEALGKLSETEQKNYKSKQDRDLKKQQIAALKEKNTASSLFEARKLEAELADKKATRDLTAQKNKNDAESNKLKASELANEKDYKKQNDLFNRTEGIRKEYTNHPTTKNTQLLSEAMGKIQSAKGDATGDMSLIYGFMKLQDPSSSVKEGEYAQAEQTRGIDSSIVALYNKARKGDKLDPEQRASIKESAANIYKSQLEQQKSVDEQYGKLAAKQGVPIDQAVMPMYSGGPSTERVPFNQSAGSIPGVQSANAAHPEMAAAVEWAKQNQKDPRSAEILKRAGVQ